MIPEDRRGVGVPGFQCGSIIGCWLSEIKFVTVLSRGDCRFSGSGSMMNRMGFSETIFLFFLALIIFGPKKLPEIARQVGKYLNEFKRASNEFKAQIEQEIAHLEVEDKKKEAENKPTILAPSSAPEGTTSRSWNSPATESLPAANPATLAVSADEPILSDISSNGSEPAIATEAIPVSDSVTSPDALTTTVSRESHA
jgi:Tat protein translocase TatB subunit